MCWAVCGGRLTAEDMATKLYSHAKYGDHNYDNKENCEWLIWAGDEEMRVMLRFSEFEVEDEADCGWVKTATALPADTRCWSNAVLMLGTDIKPALSWCIIVLARNLTWRIDFPGYGNTTLKS